MMRVWIVPRVTPNANAVAHSVDIDMPADTRFQDGADILSPLLPPGYEVIKFEREARDASDTDLKFL